MESDQGREMNRAKWLPALIALLAGCAAPARPLYSWGHYEELIYTSYATPCKVSPEMQVEQLEQDYQKARAANLPVPPGFHAYLGYLYYQLGKLDQARQEFETEKADFPESAVFMNRLLTRLEQQ
jgi:hypothetical protein